MDIVAVYPMDKLTASKQRECYLDVIRLLHKTPVTVIAISVDNAAANRKFYIDHLCDGTLKTSITDSTTGQPIFLLFDHVHTLKNVYNNCQRRGIFECSPMECNLPNGCSANFKHVTELFDIESTLSLKKAYDRMVSDILSGEQHCPVSMSDGVDFPANLLICASTDQTSEGQGVWTDNSQTVGLDMPVMTSPILSSPSRAMSINDWLEIADTGQPLSPDCLAAPMGTVCSSTGGCSSPSKAELLRWVAELEKHQ